jgi:hypothetical protein
MSENFRPLVEKYILLNDINDCQTLDNYINNFTSDVQMICDQNISKTKFNIKKKSNKWWTKELSDMRHRVCALRRRYQRCQSSNRENFKNEYKINNKLYKKLMDKQRNKIWSEFLYESSAQNPWGIVYQLLKNSTNCPKLSELVDASGSPVIDEKVISNQLFSELFSNDNHMTDNEIHKQIRVQSMNDSPGINCQPFTVSEVTKVIEEQNHKKSPGIDGLTGDIIRNLHKIDEKFLTNIYNKCLDFQYFPKYWKKSIIKIIPKPDKQDYRRTDSYRPISLIPVLGKILEKLIINRINDFLHKNSKLNSKQFGFVPQKSTEEALHSVINFIEKGFEKKGFTLIISLDITGPFNTCWWPQMLN